MRKAALCLVALAACGSTGGGGDDGYEPDPTPVANDDAITIPESGSIPTSVLLQNDVDVAVASIVHAPLHGTFANDTYVPDPGYFGEDEFTYVGQYRPYSQAVSAPATVHVTIMSDGIPYEHSTFLAAGRVTSLATGDINGDGKVDVVTSSFYDNEMTVFVNTTASEGAYSVQAQVFEGGSEPRHIAVADIDGDGKPDVLTAAADGVALFRNITQPSGPVAFEGPVHLGTAPFAALVAVDLNGDGRPDLAGAENRDYLSSTLHTWVNQSTPGGFAFGVDTTFITPPSPVELTAVDADANGQLDLALLADGKLSIFVNATAAAATVAAFQTRIDRDTGPDPRTMFLADLDADGQQEIGVLHDYGDMWIYQNRGTSTPSFEAARVVDIDPSTALVTPVDFDGSGGIDLIGMRGGNANQFELLKNDSQPQSFAFEALTANVSDSATRKLAVIGAPAGLAFVDFDGVPPLELVVGTSTGLRVLFGP